MEVFSKVYYDRVYFLRAERFMTGSDFQHSAAPPDHLKVECPPDLKAFQNNFAFIASTEKCFWLNRVSDRPFSAFQKGVSNPIIKTALRLSSAKITLKVVWKP